MLQLIKRWKHYLTQRICTDQRSRPWWRVTRSENLKTQFVHMWAVDCGCEMNICLITLFHKVTFRDWSLECYSKKKKSSPLMKPTISSSWCVSGPHLHLMLICDLYRNTLSRWGKMLVNVRCKCSQNTLWLQCSPACHLTDGCGLAHIVIRYLSQLSTKTANPYSCNTFFLLALINKVILNQ